MMTRRLFFLTLFVVIAYSAWSFGFQPWYQAIDAGDLAKVYEVVGSDASADEVGSLVLLRERSADAKASPVEGAASNKQPEVLRKPKVLKESKASKAKKPVRSSGVCKRLGAFETELGASGVAAVFEAVSAKVALMPETVGSTKTYWLSVSQAVEAARLSALEAVLARNGLVFVESDEPSLKDHHVAGPFLNQEVAEGYLKQMQLVHDGVVIEEVALVQEVFWLQVSDIVQTDLDKAFDKALKQNSVKNSFIEKKYCAKGLSLIVFLRDIT